MFLACAMEAKADFIVSRDPRLRNLKQFQGIKIIDVKEFGQWQWGQAWDMCAQRRAEYSYGCKSRHGKSQSHVAWMAGGDGNVAF